MDSYYAELETLYDGAITIFTTAKSKKRTWQLRLTLPNQSGYTRRKSLKTSNKAEALKLAQDEYLKLRAKIEQDLPTEQWSWEALTKHWVQQVTNSSRYKKTTYSRFHALNRLYLHRFFTGTANVTDITAISPSLISEYWKWRLNFWNTEQAEELKTANGRTAVTYYSKTPSVGSLRREAYFIREILTHAWKLKLIPTVPRVKCPSPSIENGVSKTDTYASFEPDEYNTFVSSIDSLATSPLTVRKDVKRRLERLRFWILLISNTGIRVEECHGLRWRDISLRYDDKNDMNYTTIEITQSVSKVGKARTVIARDYDETYKRAMRWRKFCSWELEDDLIFASHNERAQPAKMLHIFKKHLIRLGLTHDNDGRRRTATSLRHFYAEMRLLNDTSIYALAKNMGTSVQMLEQHYTRAINGWNLRNQLTQNLTN
jgi:integrase